MEFADLDIKFITRFGSTCSFTTKYFDDKVVKTLVFYTVALFETSTDEQKVVHIGDKTISILELLQSYYNEQLEMAPDKRACEIESVYKCDWKTYFTPKSTEIDKYNDYLSLKSDVKQGYWGREKRDEVWYLNSVYGNINSRNKGVRRYYENSNIPESKYKTDKYGRYFICHRYDEDDLRGKYIIPKMVSGLEHKPIDGFLKVDYDYIYEEDGYSEELPPECHLKKKEFCYKSNINFGSFDVDIIKRYQNMYRCKISPVKHIYHAGGCTQYFFKTRYQTYEKEVQKLEDVIVKFEKKEDLYYYDIKYETINVL